jgi:hypothetical protein
MQGPSRLLPIVNTESDMSTNAIAVLGTRRPSPRKCKFFVLNVCGFTAVSHVLAARECRLLSELSAL